MNLLCPILSAKKDIGNYQYCMGQKCAWWDEKKKQCVVHSILNMTAKITEDGLSSLDDVERALTLIKD